MTNPVLYPYFSSQISGRFVEARERMSPRFLVEVYAPRSTALSEPVSGASES